MKHTPIFCLSLLTFSLLGASIFTHAAPPQRVKEIKTNTTPAPGSAAEIRLFLAKAPRAADYPLAAKATLLDLADVTIRPDGSARTVTRMVKKIFNQAGRDQEAEVAIRYNGAYETLTITRARTILPSGRVIPINPAEIRETKNPSGYDDDCAKSFSFPAVAEGSLIDYEYVTDQKSSQLPGHFWSQWYFNAGRDPVMLTKLTVHAPRSLKINEKLQNSSVKAKITDTLGEKNITYVWEQEKVPSPEMEESLNPPLERVLAKLTYTTLSDWQQIAGWYQGLAKDRAVADPAIKARVAELIKGKTTPEEKAKAIFYDVQDQVRYVAIELGISAYQPRPATKTMTNLYGDCKDMATLLVAMLREAGVTAHPVLLEADSADRFPLSLASELPTPSAFNHAICLAEIDGKKYWLDATAAVCPWGTIPGADQACEGFVIRDGKGTFERITVATPEAMANTQLLSITLGADGTATGTLKITGSGDYEMSLRRAFLHQPTDRVKQTVEALARSIGANAKVANYTISDLKDKDKPVVVNANVTFPSWGKKSGDLLMFAARPDQTTGSLSSPFQSEGRVLPIVQESVQLAKTTLEVTLPEGMTVLSLPDSKDGSSALGNYKRTVTQEGNKIIITMQVIDNRAEISPKEYADLRTYFDNYLKVLEESVVLKKK
jgi:Domain of Unknown Function with PDB structure (DUF3857)/Transglutaminase-like superfamily/Domain of Unknown Function with PDB structure (DUF3858)